MSDRKYSLIDLFAGAGGLTLGFYNSKKFESVFAVEFDRAAAETYAENFDHQLRPIPDGEGRIPWSEAHTVFQGDVRRLGDVNINADVIIGGPPCQGFSPLGKITPRAEHKDMNQLWQEYMRVVHRVRPKAFLIENVPELLRSREFVAILLTAKKLGYEVEHGTLKAMEFGVPQRRVRGFIVGLLGGVAPVLPTARMITTTVEQAIRDLPLNPTTMDVVDLPEKQRGTRRQDLHIGRTPTPKSLERYRVIRPGENRFALMARRPDITPNCWKNKPTGSTDVFGRLEWDKVAYTIRTEFFKPEKGCYLHPEADRPITHREAARLQTFDDWFYFKGSKIQIARQIGNAVPPRLAEAIADQLAKQLPAVETALAAGWKPPEVDIEECLAAALDDAFGEAPLLGVLPKVDENSVETA